MSLIETHYKNIYQLLEYEDYPNLLKKLIDLTLDTEELSFYQKTVSLLDWLEQNQTNITEIRKRFNVLLDDLFSFLQKKGSKQREKLLVVQNLIKAYTQSHFALGPISLDISEGEIIGLVGENGNGKTTLLRSLCGELVPTNGRISYLFDYKDEYDLRSQLIYIPQRTKDWHGSLLSNLQFTAASYGILGEVNEHLVQLVIARMGLRGYRHLNWKSLSSGYKMRFELARMLLRKPKLLLIDEPLANLDILAQQVVLDDFRDIAKSPFRPLGIVLSSQQLYEVEKTSDRVIFLKKGQPQNADIKEGVAEFKEVAKFIVEFESDWQQEELRKVFATLSLENLQIKGGTYIAIFPESTSQERFLQIVVDNRIPLNYFRNISNSTRRFFLS
ncbi:ABC-2 type transport system ATP-binding protein [Dysgonomonas alginatilytica]|uniref:ABC-2 type transport system ATP-binding protein n=1 Tax=Dysgonomonas alginatilytica TaxID=1605892 RepID=A0A2V3PJE5_9BACT|nr:ABC transporter ATP-binding protein [Dysgonomonas alginatilytica]PXV60226.1 ABC-2 type transport system ATP-binding protein [Dysgonomonas alginatilytica]